MSFLITCIEISKSNSLKINFKIELYCNFKINSLKINSKIYLSWNFKINSLKINIRYAELFYNAVNFVKNILRITRTDAMHFELKMHTGMKFNKIIGDSGVEYLIVNEEREPLLN